MDDFCQLDNSYVDSAGAPTPEEEQMISVLKYKLLLEAVQVCR